MAIDIVAIVAGWACLWFVDPWLRNRRFERIADEVEGTNNANDLKRLSKALAQVQGGYAVRNWIAAALTAAGCASAIARL